MKPERAAADIRAALGEARDNLERVRRIADGSEVPTYANAVRALDRATDSLDRAWVYLNHLQSVADSPELRDVLNALTPEVTDFYSAIDLDEKLFAAVKKFAETA